MEQESAMPEQIDLIPIARKSRSKPPSRKPKRPKKRAEGSPLPRRKSVY